MAKGRMRWWQWEQSIKKLGEEWRKTPPDWEAWLTARQTKERLGIGRWLLEKLIREGRLGAMKDGNGRWRIRAEDVEREKNRRGDGEKGRRGAADSSFILPPSSFPEDPPPSSLSLPEVWIGAEEVATLLGVTRERVNQLARQGKLARRDGERRGAPAAFALSAVSALAASREAARWKEPDEKERWRRKRSWGANSTRLEAAERDELISRQEAAAILEVTPKRIGQMVKFGRLRGYQKKLGVSGCPLFVSLNQVVRLRDDPEHQKRHAAWKAGHESPKPMMDGWEPHDIPEQNWFEPSARTERDYGKYYTTRQVGQLLGVRKNTVHDLRKTGRLKGYQPNGPGKHSPVGNPWWYYLKEDVHKLMLDAAYLERHAQQIRARSFAGKARRAAREAEIVLRQAEACLRAMRTNRWVWEEEPMFEALPGCMRSVRERLSWERSEMLEDREMGFRDLTPQPPSLAARKLAREGGERALTVMERQLAACERANWAQREPGGIRVWTGWVWGDPRIR